MEASAEKASSYIIFGQVHGSRPGRCGPCKLSTGPCGQKQYVLPMTNAASGIDARLKRVEAEDAHDLIDLSACINKMASCIPCVPLCYNCIGLRPQAHSRKCLPQNAARQPDLP